MWDLIVSVPEGKEIQYPVFEKRCRPASRTFSA